MVRRTWSVLFISCAKSARCTVIYAPTMLKPGRLFYALFVSQKSLSLPIHMELSTDKHSNGQMSNCTNANYMLFVML